AEGNRTPAAFELLYEEQQQVIIRNKIQEVVNVDLSLDPLLDLLVSPICFLRAFILEGEAVFVFANANRDYRVIILHVSNFREFVARTDVRLWRPTNSRKLDT